MRTWARTLDATMRADGASLLAYARELCGDPETAERLLEDALTRTFARARVPEGRDDARGAVRDELRRAAVQLDAPAGEAREAADPFAPPGPVLPLDGTDASSTRAALAALTPRERAVLVMRYSDGLAVPAIAAGAHLHEAAVRDALTTAVTRLLALEPRLGLRVEDALEGGVLDSAAVTVEAG
ncbi:hypothetical protein QQX09_13930 [Demequina sp. SYSU T00192]|uniref:RNA polymerase sigma-70 region 4 domain-containing protein n=1 Tax=Demequina litoralis TaxID=3051660 RepID=A0ABT8GCU9_9MICO|nr:hypothetical protein [Demequina sp. SYSU T00192]MDN4476954.1 hypothetical protein [Demequina sp. SYSU T00192]